jgi:ribosomal-protein-alanine N-acetyltransferase
MSIEIRPATQADLEPILAIAAESPEAPQWQPSGYNPYLSSQTSNPALRRTALIASSQQKILAFAAASLLLITDSAGHENTCQLDSMAVQPEARRQGLATALLHAIRNWAAQNNARHLTLEVRAGNTPAIALYHRLGLRPEGRRPRYYAHPEEDAVVLGIPLP